MSWQQLELRLAARALPQAEALLELLGVVSISLLAGADDEILEPEPGTTPLWPSLRVRALFRPETDLEPIERILTASFGSGTVARGTPLAEATWLDAARQSPAPRALGRRLLLAGADAELAASDRIVIRLRRGLAFGTGDHPTTRLCLEWLDANLKADCTVIDYGCGSGILAIAALRLGARRAWGVDIEPQALDASADNARLNAVSEQLWLGTPDALPSLRSDVLIANMLANPLLGLASTFAACCTPAGALVLGGILPGQCAAMEAAYAPHFCNFRRTLRDDWACIAAVRNDDGS